MTRSVFSLITTWTIRILLFFIALGAISLLMLTTMGGTTESHRKGLEQAFSDSMDADVKLGKLTEFNIIPQLTLKTENIQGVSRKSKNEFLMDELVISFGFADLTLGRRQIEDFQLKNFRFSADSEYDLRIDHAGIEKTKKPVFSVAGQQDHKDFDLTIPLQMKAEARPVYYFGKENAINGKYGSLTFSGNLVPTTEQDKKFIKDLKIMNGNDVVANAYAGEKQAGGYKLTIECVGGYKASPEVQSDFASLAKVKYFELSESCPK